MGQKGHHETSGPYLQTATAPLSLSLSLFAHSFPMAFPPDRGTADVGKGRDSSVKTISVEWAEGRGGRHRHFVRLSAPFNEEGGEGGGLWGRGRGRGHLLSRFVRH